MSSYPLLDALMKEHQTLKWEQLDGTNLELFEERLRILSKNHDVYDSLTRKFLQDIRNRTDYLDFATIMRLAIILLRAAHDISFVLKATPKEEADLSAKIKGQTVLFTVSRYDGLIGLDESPIVSKVCALADKIRDLGDPIVLALEVDAVGYALNFIQPTLKGKLSDAKLNSNVSALILLYPETIGFASLKQTESRDLGIFVAVLSPKYPLGPGVQSKLGKMLRTPVGFNGEGVESRNKNQMIVEAIGAAMYGFFSMQGFATAYKLVPALSAESPIISSFSWVFSAALFVMVLFRRTFATEPRLSNYDFRLLRALQDLPKFLLGFFAIVSVWIAISLIPGSSVASLPIGAGVAYVTSGLVLCLPVYLVTRFYSSAGFARVYLLQFVKDQAASSQWLLPAASSLNRRFSELGLRFDPYDFRAGVNLGLMKGKISLSDLSDLADNVVGNGSAQERIVIDRVEKVLKQVNQGPLILSSRPLKSRFPADRLTTVLGALPPIITLILVVLKLLLNIPIPL